MTRAARKMMMKMLEKMEGMAMTQKRIEILLGDWNPSSMGILPG